MEAFPSTFRVEHVSVSDVHCTMLPAQKQQQQFTLRVIQQRLFNLLLLVHGQNRGFPTKPANESAETTARWPSSSSFRRSRPVCFYPGSKRSNGVPQPAACASVISIGWSIQIHLRRPTAKLRLSLTVHRTAITGWWEPFPAKTMCWQSYRSKVAKILSELNARCFTIQSSDSSEAYKRSS